MVSAIQRKNLLSSGNNFFRYSVDSKGEKFLSFYSIPHFQKGIDVQESKREVTKVAPLVEMAKKKKKSSY